MDMIGNLQEMCSRRDGEQDTIALPWAGQGGMGRPDGSVWIGMDLLPPAAAAAAAWIVGCWIRPCEWFIEAGIPDAFGILYAFAVFIRIRLYDKSKDISAAPHRARVSILGSRESSVWVPLQWASTLKVAYQGGNSEGTPFEYIPAVYCAIAWLPIISCFHALPVPRIWGADWAFERNR